MSALKKRSFLGRSDDARDALNRVRNAHRVIRDMKVKRSAIVGVDHAKKRRISFA
jgi:hypothetical protein